MRRRPSHRSEGGGGDGHVRAPRENRSEGNVLGYMFSRSGRAIPTARPVAPQGLASSLARSTGGSTRTERLRPADRSSGNSARESRWENDCKRTHTTKYGLLKAPKSDRTDPFATDSRFPTPREARSSGPRPSRGGEPGGGCVRRRLFRPDRRRIRGCDSPSLPVGRLPDRACRRPWPAGGNARRAPPPSRAGAVARRGISRPGRARRRRTSRACRSGRRSPWRRGRDRASTSGSATSGHIRR